MPRFALLCVASSIQTPLGIRNQILRKLLAWVCTMVLSMGQLLAQEPDFKHPIQVSGGFNGSTGFYTAFGAPSRRPPFTYSLNASLNFKVLGMIDVPFSASFSQQQASFAQPFNQYGISPKYKWITAHIGYRNMTFSDFTLAGHTFLGGGVELTPGKWKIGAVAGRFRKAIEEADALANGATTSYGRMGYGLQVGWENNGNGIEGCVFKARDNVNSINAPTQSSDVTPEEGLVMGIKGKKKIGKKLDVEAEYAQSAITRDIRGPVAVNEGGGASSLSYFGGLFQRRSGSASHAAYQGKINYKAKAFNLGLKYKHVDTDYRTLGAYFFANDVEDATLNGSTTLFKSKLNLSASVGGQRNDLAHVKATRNSRLIYSANVGYAPSEKWNFSVNGSNFSSFLKVDQNILTDSLNFYQVTRNAAVNAMHMYGGEENKQSLSANVSYQNAVGRKEYSILPDNVTDFYNVALAHTLKLKKQNMDVSSMVSYTHTIVPGTTTSFIGPSAGVGKSILQKKAKVMFRTSFQMIFTDGALSSTVFTNRLNGNYKLGKHHGITASIDFLRKSAVTTTTTKLSEMRGTVGYSFNF